MMTREEIARIEDANDDGSITEGDVRTLVDELLKTRALHGLEVERLEAVARETLADVRERRLLEAKVEQLEASLLEALWTCDRCEFTFASREKDADGSVSCVRCSEADLFAKVERLTAEIKYMKSGCEDMSAEKAAALRAENKKLVLEAEIRGIRRYAWWKDGVEYVGAGVYTLKDALVAAIAVEAKCASRRDSKRAALRSTGDNDGT
jgi:hypothetical protein